MVTQPETAGFLADLQAFFVQWGLDASAQGMLLEQSPEVQARVIMEFQPKPGTRDVNRLFHGFLKSVRTTAPGAARPQEFAFAAPAATQPVLSIMPPRREEHVYIAASAPQP